MTLGVDWGDVPAWIGSIGTAVAFILAAWVYLQSFRDRRAEQARKVAAWAPGGITLLSPGEEIPRTPMTVDVESIHTLVHVYNLSDELVSDLTMRLVRLDGTEFDERARTHWTDVGPGQRIENGIRLPYDGRPLTPLRVQIEFTDAAGRRWRRLGGTLRRA